MIRLPPSSTLDRSSAASDVYKRQAFGNLDCDYELGAESGAVLSLRYKPTDSWEDIEVTFDGADKASWKNLTETKSDPDATPTKLVRTK